VAWRSPSDAIPLDKDGDIKLGVRTYVNARVGTETTHDGVPLSSATRYKPVVTTSTSATFPHSAAGHLRQNRFFIEAELNHDLSRLLKEGVGPFSLLNDLPFKFKSLSYHATFRGEGEGLYDWGPREYSTADQFYTVQRVNGQAVGKQGFVDVPAARRKLRRLSVDRERLFQGYLETTVGPLFLRLGRQILSWGETDGFQLLDHINPIDSSFGGFLISLDERRVPLDMLRSQYYIGDFGPISEMFLEGYAAIDNKVGYYPGTAAGSPWALPSLGAPGNATKTFSLRPARTIDNTRGGARLVFNAFNATFSIAHYYTHFDVPAVQVFTTTGGVTSQPFNDHLACPADPRSPPDPRLGNSEDPTKQNCGFPTHAVLTAPQVQVSGLTSTFAVPQIFSVVRSEVAYFKDEPAFTQGQLDPFIFNGKGGVNGFNPTGGRRLRDSINAVLGLDVNQWIRFLNPNQTFFISTQFFYKHIKNAAGSKLFVTNADGETFPNPDREVLPIDLTVIDPGIGTKVEPVFISQPRDQFLQTLFITTSYRSGTISPSLIVFYDWGVGLVYLPSITFSRDPFRFSIDYSIIDSHIYKGGSGVSLLKDRDNVQFRIEYVI